LADSVVLLDGGRVVAVGTHEELLLNDERYQNVLAGWQESDDDDTEVDI